MNAAPRLLATKREDASTKVEGQPQIVLDMATRVRGCAMTLGLTASSLGEAVGVSSSSAANYWNGKRPWPTEVLARLADVLNTNVDVLVRGVATNVGQIVEASAADWVMVPTYDLTNMHDGGKGPVIRTTPIRRDWLSKLAGSATGLWLTDVPCDYPPLNLVEGDKVLCKDITVPELHDRHLCIWRETDIAQMFIGRYSLVRLESVHIDNDREYWVGKVSVAYADPVPSIFPVGRIIGRPMMRLR